MRRYELMLLLRPDLDDEHLQAAVERVTRAIVNAGGSLSKVSPWGKRRLAYEISHQRDASYFLIHFEIDPAAIRGIERGMQISEEILRHMLTILEDRPTGRSDGDATRSRTGAPRAETAGDDSDVLDADASPESAADVDDTDLPDTDIADEDADDADVEVTADLPEAPTGDGGQAEEAGSAPTEEAEDAPARAET